MNSRIETALLDFTIYSGLFHVYPNAWLSSLLIPLNLCRRKNNYKPWDCHHERHAYEQCQYDDYVRRMKELSKQKLAAAEDA
ncbi:hypothetical protein D9619_008089 [Psilocybe cf. subviscida]|uniref:NADH dehydrogenase [ubiquinone] 1 beta subcomplex subunit 7 n=1 Tax=Psilocybe cf. subviscida TaxID=2480587 RepID=A0A8H5ATZ3_9AGAR|nr:hypothetical protein D9619_008089 [Psilocybe cf. subviscida]